MSIAKHLSQKLNQANIQYRIIKHTRTSNPIQAAESSRIPLKQFLQSMLFKTADNKTLMVVLPLNCVIDFHQLNRVIHQTVRPLSRQELFLLFSDCESGAYSPLSYTAGMQVILDTRIGALKTVHFEAGSHTDVLALNLVDFKQLNHTATWANIAQDDTKINTQHVHRFTATANSDACLTVDCEIKKRFEQLYQAPTMPDSMKPDFSSDCHMDQAALSDIFQVEHAGPLGLAAHWRHAMYTARLNKTLAKKVSSDLDSRLSYQAGFLHNVGFMLFGHLFKPEFQLLNKLIQANPNAPITLLEKHAIGMGQAKHVMGMGHGHLGAWLLNDWQMPEEMVVVQKEHHNPDYTGEHWEYSAITLVANHLLRRVNIGDAETGELPGELMSRLGLSEADGEQVLNSVIAGSKDLAQTHGQHAA